jgi:hypothetical protein
MVPGVIALVSQMILTLSKVFLLMFKYKKNALIEGVSSKDVYADVKLCVESLIHYKDDLNELFDMIKDIIS